MFAEGFDPLGAYNIVTPAFVLELIRLGYTVQRQALEIERLKALLEKK